VNKKVRNGGQLTPGESPKFQLKRGRERKLGVEELAAIVGGGASGVCCLQCNTTDGATICRCPP
jgi:hypothetical protein